MEERVATQTTYSWIPGFGLQIRVGEAVAIAFCRSDQTIDERRRVLAAGILGHSEAERLHRPRSPKVAAALAGVFARDCLQAFPFEPFEISGQEVLDWIDGPGIQIILDAGVRSAHRTGAPMAKPGKVDPDPHPAPAWSHAQF